MGDIDLDDVPYLGQRARPDNGPARVAGPNPDEAEARALNERLRQQRAQDERPGPPGIHRNEGGSQRPAQGHLGQPPRRDERAQEPRRPYPEQQRPRDQQRAAERSPEPFSFDPQRLPRAGRANDQMASPADRRNARRATTSRGLIAISRIERTNRNVWLLFGFATFLNSLLTTIYGVIGIWREVKDLDSGSAVSWTPYIIGGIMGLMFVAGQMSFGPGIWRKIRDREPQDVPTLVLYLVCVIPDTVSTGLFHWVYWVHKWLSKVLVAPIDGVLVSNSPAVFWSSFALCLTLALVSSLFPLLAVVKNE